MPTRPRRPAVAPDAHPRPSARRARASRTSTWRRRSHRSHRLRDYRNLVGPGAPVGSTLRARAVPVRDSTKMTDWLASEARKLEKRGVAEPFVFTDMKHWLPAWMTPSDACGTADEPEASKEVRDLARALGAAPANDPKKGMFITSWAIAWQRRGVAPQRVSAAERDIAGTVWRPWRSASSRRMRSCSIWRRS